MYFCILVLLSDIFAHKKSRRLLNVLDLYTLYALSISGCSLILIHSILEMPITVIVYSQLLCTCSSMLSGFMFII